MSQERSAAFPTHSTRNLLARALEAARADSLDDGSSPAADLFEALCSRRDEETFQLASELIRSADTFERLFGATLLGGLAEGAVAEMSNENGARGNPRESEPSESTEPDFVDAIPALLGGLLRDEDPEVVEAAILALGNFELEESDATLLAELSSLARSPRAELRRAVASALGGVETDEGLEILIQLCDDEDAATRNWATFGLAQLTERDSEDLRSALLRRVRDPDEEVRGEALLGLALRADARVEEPLEKALQGDTVGELELQAAQALGAPSLLPALLDLRDWWDAEDQALEEAIAACRSAALR